MKKRGILLSAIVLALVLVLMATVLVACDSANTYKITFVDGDPNAVEVKAGDAIGDLPDYVGTPPTGKRFDHWAIADAEGNPTEQKVDANYKPEADGKAVAVFVDEEPAPPAAPTANDFVGVWADDVNHVMIYIAKDANGKFDFDGFVEKADVDTADAEAYDATNNKFIIAHREIAGADWDKKYEFALDGENVVMTYTVKVNDAEEKENYTLAKRTGGEFIGEWWSTGYNNITVVDGDYVLNYHDANYAHIVKNENQYSIAYLDGDAIENMEFTVNSVGIELIGRLYIKDAVYEKEYSASSAVKLYSFSKTVDTEKTYIYFLYKDSEYYSASLSGTIAANAILTITYGDNQTILAKFGTSTFSIGEEPRAITGPDGDIMTDGFDGYTKDGVALVQNTLANDLWYTAEKAYKINATQSTYTLAVADKFADTKYNLQNFQYGTLYAEFDGVGRMTIGGTDEGDPINKSGYYFYNESENTIEFDCSFYAYSAGPYDIEENGNVFVYDSYIFIKDGFSFTDKTENFYGYWTDAEDHYLYIYSEYGRIYVEDGRYDLTDKEGSKNYDGSVLTYYGYAYFDDYDSGYVNVVLTQTDTHKLSYTATNYYDPQQTYVSAVEYTWQSIAKPFGGFESDIQGSYHMHDGKAVVIEATRMTIDSTEVTDLDKQNYYGWVYYFTYNSQRSQVFVGENGEVILIFADNYYSPQWYLFKDGVSATYEDINGTYHGQMDDKDITLEIAATGIKFNNITPTYVMNLDGGYVFAVHNAAGFDEYSEFVFDGESLTYVNDYEMYPVDLSKEGAQPAKTIYGTWTCGIYEITITDEDGIVSITATGGNDINSYGIAMEPGVEYMIDTLTIHYNADADTLTVTDSNDDTYSGTYHRA